MKIIAIGRNYAAHIEELNNERPESPVKINKEGKYIQQQFAHKYYNEIGIGIDFTARDLQQKCKEKGLPWEIAKAFNGSAPLGQFKPISDFPDISNINFHLDINGAKQETPHCCYFLLM